MQPPQLVKPNRQRSDSMPSCIYHALDEQRSSSLIITVKEQVSEEVANSLRIKISSHDIGIWLYSKMRYLAGRYVKKLYA